MRREAECHAHEKEAKAVPRLHALGPLRGLQHDPAVVFGVALVCGALSDAAGSPLRLPFELVGKNVQAGRTREPRRAKQ